jgi:probable phosphoglycerate mutase
VILVRHGQTEWSRAGKHTSHTDVALTELGMCQAAALGDALRARPIAMVLSSPRRRALDTCRLAGFGDEVMVTEDLAEWDYGDYEGRTTVEIHTTRPAWSLWTDGVPGGEQASAVEARADAALATALGAPGNGDALLFAHGHILRVVAARWLGLSAGAGRHFALDNATVSVLGHERSTPVISLWNDGSHLPPMVTETARTSHS